MIFFVFHLLFESTSYVDIAADLNHRYFLRKMKEKSIDFLTKCRDAKLILSREHMARSGREAKLSVASRTDSFRYGPIILDWIE